MQLAALRPVALIHKDEDLAHGLAWLGFQVLDEGFKVVHVPAAEFVDQRAQQPRRGLAKLPHQVAAARGPFDRLAHLGEDPLNLLVQLIAVGDQRHAGVGIVLQNPLGQQHHHNALAAALGVPDDAALPLAHVLLRGLDAEVLMDAGQLLSAAVEEHKVMHQLDDPVLAAHLEQILVQLEAAVVFLVFLPAQEVFFLRANGAIAQPFGVVAGKDELHRREEPGVELRLLVRKILADAVADANPAVLQLDYADGDAIDVEHQIGPPLQIALMQVALERHLFGDGEVVLLRLLPIHELHGLGGLGGIGLYRHAVAQQLVDGLVVGIEIAAVVVGLGAQLVESRADLRRGISAPRQPRRQNPRLDVAVAVAVAPVAQVAIAQLIHKELDHALLRGALRLADLVHSSRILPVRSSCIMPVFNWRALVSLVSSKVICTSMSDRIVAVCICSSGLFGIAAVKS